MLLCDVALALGTVNHYREGLLGFGLELTFTESLRLLASIVLYRLVTPHLKRTSGEDGLEQVACILAPEL